MFKPRNSTVQNRRRFLKAAGLSAVAFTGHAAWLTRLGNAAEAITAHSAWPKTLKLPEKADLVLLSDRPPNLETPLKYFREDITPNEVITRVGGAG